MGPDGYPGPPGCAGHDPHARRRRIPPRATSVPATPLKWDEMPRFINQGRNTVKRENIKFFIPYPRPQNLAYPARVLSNEGALLEALLKWDRAKAWPGRGNPSRSDAAPAAVFRTHGIGGPWVTVRAHYGALPSMAGRDR